MQGWNISYSELTQQVAKSTCKYVHHLVRYKLKAKLKLPPPGSADDC